MEARGDLAWHFNGRRALDVRCQRRTLTTWPWPGGQLITRFGIVGAGPQGLFTKSHVLTLGIGAPETGCGLRSRFLRRRSWADSKELTEWRAKQRPGPWRDRAATS